MQTFEMKTMIHFGPNALDRLKTIPYQRILIITDGEFDYPDEEFTSRLNAARENPGVMIHSIVIGCDPYGLKEFADRIVMIEDLRESSENGRLNGQISESLQGLI